MIRIQKITALLCALALAASSFGAYADNARAASFPVTSDDAPLYRETPERSPARSTRANTGAQKLKPGKKVQGWLVTGDDGQSYQITLKSSGQLDIHLEDDSRKLAGYLTDQNGKSWAPRRRTANGKQTYQLKKGTYYYQIQVAKGTVIPETGLDYEVTATFQSAQAKFEDNDTRKNAIKLPSNKIFYGHLAQNAPVEYYKFTLKSISRITFCIATQITDYTPETYVVTLYDKYGKALSVWENLDLVKYYKEFNAEYRFEKSDWWWWDWTQSEAGEMGLHEVLPAGTYYVGVSVRRDAMGKVSSSARYGKYAVRTAISKQGLSVKLSKKQTEYTGKKIKPPKVTIKKNFKKAYYQDWERNTSSKSYDIIGITKDSGYYSSTIKGIGRYMIVQDRWWVSPDLDAPDATASYAIFTVTPIRGKISHVSSKKKGQVQVSVKKNAQSTGYQIQIARDKKFKKSVKTLKAAGTRKTIKGLSHGKKYYIRVRNYKDVKTYYCSDIAVPESIYGKWSKVKAVVCK